MKHPPLDSLYVRLVLVLAVALAAGFVTIGLVFQNDMERHMAQMRSHGAQQGLAERIRLVEGLLGKNPEANVPADTGFEVFRGEIPPDSTTEPPFPVPPDADRHLAALLGRPVTLRYSQDFSGPWLRLETKEPIWLRLVPGPGLEELLPHPDWDHDFPGGPPEPGYEHGHEPPGRGPRPSGGPRPGMMPWTWGLLVSFGVVFIGGMALLWRVQVPLRKLERALDETRPNATPAPLALQGPGEVKRLAERFNRMRARLQRHEQDREVMLAGVAHDLRAPVTRLRLQLELENGSRREAMLRNLDSVEAIVDQFLLYARGGEAEERTEWEMNAFAAEVAAPYEDRSVSFHGSGADLIASIRPSSLRRALCNLIENALEYGAAPVEVGLREEGGRILLTVRDHGPGISAADRERALRPFTRLDAARGGPGHCGLGLAIAGHIAESHGGTLILDDAPGGGLAATLSLPVDA